MNGRSALLLLAVVCGVLVCRGQADPVPDHTLGLGSLTASEVELQRVPVLPLELEGLSPSALNGDYSHAIYAGRFAQQLNRLEKAKNPIYVDFISSGFTGAEVPRDLPSDLQKLSRTAPTPLVSPIIASVRRIGPITTSSSSSRSSSGGNSFVFPIEPAEFASNSFLPRRRNRQAFVRDTRARGFPFARGLGAK